MINVILQFPELDLVNINVSAKFYQNIANFLRIKFHLFSEFGPRQNLDQSQMSFDYLMSYIMSISMCMQNFIIIFHSVQETESFSLFQNLELGRPMKNVISQSLGLDFVNINVYAKVYQNIPLSSRDRAIFTFFRIWRSAKPRPMINVILQSLGLDIVNINAYAKFYQNIPNGLELSTFFTNSPVTKSSQTVQ